MYESGIESKALVETSETRPHIVRAGPVRMVNTHTCDKVDRAVQTSVSKVRVKRLTLGDIVRWRYTMQATLHSIDGSETLDSVNYHDFFVNSEEKEELSSKFTSRLYGSGWNPKATTSDIQKGSGKYSSKKGNQNTACVSEAPRAQTSQPKNEARHYPSNWFQELQVGIRTLSAIQIVDRGEPKIRKR
jgi:hypothetical protein